MSANIYDSTNEVLVPFAGNNGPSVMAGATASANGSSGLTPQPMAGDQDKFLKGDGSWAAAAADDNFVGTLSEWNALSQAEKDEYKTIDLVNDINGYGIDSTPTANSGNLVTSGGVYSSVNGTITSQTLSAGNTQVTFSSIPTSGNYMVEFFTSTGINYTAIDTSTAGQVILTFDVQESSVIVYCRVREV